MGGQSGNTSSGGMNGGYGGYPSSGGYQQSYPSSSSGSYGNGGYQPGQNYGANGGSGGQQYAYQGGMGGQQYGTSGGGMNGGYGGQQSGGGMGTMGNVFLGQIGTPGQPGYRPDLTGQQGSMGGQPYGMGGQQGYQPQYGQSMFGGMGQQWPQFGNMMGYGGGGYGGYNKGQPFMRSGYQSPDWSRPIIQVTDGTAGGSMAPAQASLPAETPAVPGPVNERELMSQGSSGGLG